MTSSLAGKRCVITGGSRGIGLAIAQLFAREGAACTLAARDAGALDRAVAGLTPTPAPSQTNPHGAVAMDVANPDAWEILVTTVKNEKTDILVNAAGVAQNSFLFRTSLADTRQIVNTNLMGTIFGCQAFVPKMIKQKEGLTRSLAWEVGGFGIRANVLLPGYIETDMTTSMNDKGELSALIPMGRLGLAEEVADAALFLAKNTYAHNCVLNIDGGLSGT
ncbi:hypothetical protein DL768_001771 [Monosporascus sp. mg162]|nr:hypothetical protein DL768_001771 [Monosporascus sp. mg162]